MGKPDIQENRYTLIDNKTGKKIDLDGITPTYGKPGVDIGKLRAEFGLETHDPAYKSTSSCVSDVTYIDGEEGTLLHRGYSIQDLTNNSNYMEITHLLLNGELPTKNELKSFEKDMVASMAVPKYVSWIVNAFPEYADPMDVLASAVSAISATSDDSNQCAMIAQLPTLVALIIRKNQGKEKMIQPDPKLGFTENFVRMAFAEDDGRYTASPVLTEAMDKLLILHADHEQNASTSVVRSARSAKTKIAATIAAGIATLAGPLHGGANQKVLEQLEEIEKQNPELSIADKIKKVIARAKDKKDSFRLMGFGHRVYTNRDPRAGVLKTFVDKLLNDLDQHDPKLDIAYELEEAAMADDYFIERNLYPNVDFYSGLAMKAMGIDPKLFTLLFAAGRVSGWTAQAEELDRSGQPISRPRQQYTGEKERAVAPIGQRLG